MELARRVVGDAVDRCDIDIAAFLDEAVNRIDDGTKVTVRIHPDQRQTVDRWLAGVGHDAVHLHVDESLDRCDVVVESASGVVDGRIATRHKRVEDAVRAAVGRP